VPFQSQIIDRYKRMECSLEETLIEMYLQELIFNESLALFSRTTTLSPSVTFAASIQAVSRQFFAGKGLFGTARDP